MKYISWVVCVDGVNEEFKTLKDITAKYPELTRQRVSYKANHGQNLRKSKIDKNITIKKINTKQEREALSKEYIAVPCDNITECLV